MLLYNQYEYDISDLDEESVDGELILFNAESQMIMTLNQTATTIYQLLVNKKEEMVDINKVVDHQMTMYGISSDQKNSVHLDTKEVIEKMIELNILKCIDRE